MILEADYNTWVNTILFPFLPVITVFVCSYLMLGDLPFDDDDDDDDGGGGVMTPVCDYVPSGA